ncbi:hypothetical protein EDD86DRAFT_205598 [Gorgonomyces haynaldii]|nr:hypothetical protein EDD86DRAFT_205598 [Gorgonomyces haynaldii]
MFFHLVSAAHVLTMDWIEDRECQTAPYSIFGFNVTNTTTYPGENEAFPSTYTFLNLYGCGSMGVPLKGACCQSITYENLTLTGNLTASISVLSPGPLSLTSVPSQYNGATYCDTIALDPESLLGFNRMMIKPSNHCVEMLFKCSADGILELYMPPEDLEVDKPCEGQLLEVFELTSELQVFESMYLGYFTGQMRTLKEAKSYIQWTIYEPVYLLYFSTPFESFCEICFILSFVIAYFYAGYLLYKIYKGHNKRNFWNLTNLFTMIILAVTFTLMYVMYRQKNAIVKLQETTTGFLEGLKWDVLGALLNFFLSVSMLVLIFLIHNTLVLPLIARFTRKIYSILSYIALLLVFLGLEGWMFVAIPKLMAAQRMYDEVLKHTKGNYVEITPEINAMIDSVRQISRVQGKWSYADPYWTIFFMAYNVVPPLIVSWQLLRYTTKQTKKQMEILLRADKYFFYRIAMQVINISVYFTILGVQIYTDLLKNDRNVSASGSIMQLCISNFMIFSIQIAKTMVHINSVSSNRQSEWSTNFDSNTVLKGQSQSIRLEKTATIVE